MLLYKPASKDQALNTRPAASGQEQGAPARRGHERNRPGWAFVGGGCCPTTRTPLSPEIQDTHMSCSGQDQPEYMLPRREEKEQLRSASDTKTRA